MKGESEDGAESVDERVEKRQEKKDEDTGGIL